MKVQFIKIFIGTLALLLLISCSKDDNAVSFTADMIQQVKNRRIEGKIFVRGNEYRMDITEKGEELSILVDRKSGRQKVIEHSNKFGREYLNTSSKSLSNNPFEKFNYVLKKHSSSKKGSEIINGYECTKIEVSEGDEKLLTAWVSDTLNWPIKIVTEGKPKMDADLSNIKEEPIEESLFRVPEGYKISLLPAVNIDEMEKIILRKVAKKGIKRETEEGRIEVRGFGVSVLGRYFPRWKFFRVVREKETEKSTSSRKSRNIYVMNAAFSKEDKTFYLFDPPKSDMSIDIGLKIFQNDKIKLNNEEEVKNFGKALTLLYFVGVRVESVESLGGNKWAIYLGTPPGKSGGFIIQVNDRGKIKGIDYKLRMK
jgi:outer membrane lipoprotein-sorting protein